MTEDILGKSFKLGRKRSSPDQERQYRATASEVLNTKSNESEYKESRVAGSLEDFENQLIKIEAQSRALSKMVDSISTQKVKEAEEQYQNSVANLKVELDESLSEEKKAHSSQSKLSLDVLLDALKELAPGSAGSTWTGDLESLQSVVLSDHARVGSFTEQPDVAAVIPFWNVKSWHIRGEGEVVENLIKTAALRTVAQIPVNHLQIHIFDFTLNGGGLGVFSDLRNVNQETFPLPLSLPEELRKSLQLATVSATVVAEQLSAVGATNLQDLWKKTDIKQGTFHLFVILNYPLGIDQECQELLKKLAISGPSRGVSMIVQEPLNYDKPERYLPEDLTRSLTTIEVNSSDGTIRIPEYFSDSVSPDSAPPQRVISDVIKNADELASKEQGPVKPLEDLIKVWVDSPWTESSVESVEGVIGFQGREPISVGFRTENPSHVNMLVGGAVGQGKSNLLLDIIYSLSVKYSPDELSLVLLDFKQGLEFKRFDKDENGKNWLPHVDVLSLESNRSFGLAILEYVLEDLDLRSEVFRQAGANSIKEYRNITGKKMPRRVVIIDEFHALLDPNDSIAQEAVSALERIARQGRAYGVHLLLSSQTLSNIPGLIQRQDAIFGQFATRISLKNTAGESQTILSSGNTAAASLVYRGEMIVNRNFGNDPENSNERAVAAFANKEFLTKLQAQLWQLGQDSTPPSVFLGRSPAIIDMSQLAQLSSGDINGEIQLWLGRPVAVTSEPSRKILVRDPDQGIAIVGSGLAETAGLVGGIILSASVSLPKGSKIVILNALEDQGVVGSQWLDNVIQASIKLGIHVEQIAAENITDWLTGALAEQLENPDQMPRTIVVGLGMQRVQGMDIPMGDAGKTASDVVADICRTGGISGMYFIGSWSTVRSFEKVFGYGLGGIATIISLNLSRQDFQGLAGPLAEPPEGSPRIAVIERNSDAGVSVVTPFSLFGAAELQEFNEMNYEK